LGRILVDAAHAILVVQMRSRRRAGGAHVADHFPLGHLVTATRASTEPRHVTIERCDAVAMIDDHGIAVAALAAGELHSPVTGCLDRRAARRAIVNTRVRPDTAADRVLTPRVEVRGDAREVEWRAEEGLAHAAAIRREVPEDLAVRGLEPDRAVLLAG